MSRITEERAAEMRREYLQSWRKKNPEKVKQYNRKYWLRKAEKQSEGMSGGETCAEDQTDS